MFIKRLFSRLVSIFTAPSDKNWSGWQEIDISGHGRLPTFEHLRRFLCNSIECAIGSWVDIEYPPVYWDGTYTWRMVPLACHQPGVHGSTKFAIIAIPAIPNGKIRVKVIKTV